MPSTTHSDPDMPAEMTSRKACSAKFYRSGAPMKLPLYLDDRVQARFTALAEVRGVELSSLANNLLHQDLERIEAAR